MLANLWTHRYDALAGVGAAVITVGVGLIYTPAGVIVGGLYLLIMAVLGAMGEAHK